MKFITAIAVMVLGLGLGACAPGNLTDEQKAQRLERIVQTRQTLEALITTYQDAGIDVGTIPRERLIYLSLLCTTATVLVPIWVDEDIAELSIEAGNWCQLITETLGETAAAPLVAPVPIPRAA